MKTEDLMIGDWLYLGKTDIAVRVIALSAEEDDTILVKYQEPDRWGKYVELVGGEDVAPVPLTPEILKKNGFGYTEIDPYSNVTHYYPGEPQYCADMDLHIGGIYKGIFWLNTYKNVISNIRFVHELQHAFRICKINKEIEL